MGESFGGWGDGEATLGGFFEAGIHDPANLGHRVDDFIGGDDAFYPGEGEITDTDRYSFTLAGVATLGIWVDRRISSLSGDVDLAA